MSLKGVEMQVALPRTIDAGKISEQLQQRSQQANTLANAQTQKELEQKRTTVVKEESKAEAKLYRENHEQSNQRDANHSQKQQESPEEKVLVKESHPYKGLKFDISG